MPRSKNPQPSYLNHKPTGQAYCRIPDGNGGRKTLYLGAYNSPESLEAYRKLIAELKVSVSEVVVPELKPAGGASVNEVMLAFWKHAEQHYRHPDGTPTSEVWCLRLAIKPLRELYGHTPAREFGPSDC